MEAKHRVFVYFPPNHYSSDLNAITGGAVFLSRYEKRFKQSLLPDVIHLDKYDYDLHIPEKWKQYRNKKWPVIPNPEGEKSPYFLIIALSG